MTNQPLINPDDFEIQTTPVFKLKDYPLNRAFQLINLKTVFGKVPEIIAIGKVRGFNNKLVVQAFIKKDKKKVAKK